MPAEPAEVTLSDDDKAVALREIKDSHFALATVAQALNDGQPGRRELVENCLQVCEYHLADLSRLLRIPSQTAAKLEERHAKLRTANQRIRDLETQLGQAQAPERTQLSLGVLDEQLRGWWQVAGFGHTSEIHFQRYGCEVDFSAHLFGNFRLIKSPTPISDKERRTQWHAALRAQGYVLSEDDINSRDLEVIDCAATRATLTTLFEACLPSAEIRSFKNRRNRNDEFVLDSVSVLIRQFADIASLPAVERE